MVPPRTVIREQILAATERVIAECGYAGATTKAIAKAARCSEGSLYNYFPDKRALFMECAFAQNAGLLDRLTSLPDRVGEATVDENLVELLEAMLAFQERLVPVLLTTWASADHVAAARQHAEAAKEHALAAREQAREYARAVRKNPYGTPDAHLHDAHEAMHAAIPEELRGGPHKLVAAYLEGERAIGRVRADLDTDAAAWLLMSIPFNAAFLDTVKPGIDMPLGPHDRIARTVAVVIDGMR
ncbi:MAG TPA: TetR/AcrR family transcriptional regulator [Acidimicrobiia bacterium]